MGKVLKTMTLDNGTVVKENGCSDYVCRYCGGRATACNYVANMCLQVAAKHVGVCGAYVNNDQYSGYVTDCSTCKYHENGVGCTYGD